MLRFENLGKRYGDHLVFDGLTAAFSAGCIALCEADSTGKSSLLRIVAGAMAPDAGEVWIDGHSLAQAPRLARARLAYVPEDCLADPAQTGRGLLAQVALGKNTRVDDSALDLADRLGLGPHLDKPFEQMSTGTRRKVFLAAAAIGHPAVVVADGPGDGLDTQARRALAAQFSTWAKDRVILFASHDAELVQACATARFNLGQP
ncbi:ATP-binding cassette domain-containing protein [Castellaniella hirudinis]|uniref:ABC transporter ATP-binding protein n=1 Tax=Castellaniella hirudinis TaxID=1144617 RepID=UPI0039C2E85F